MLIRICSSAVLLAALSLGGPLTAQDADEPQVVEVIKQALNAAARSGESQLDELIAKDALITDPGGNLSQGADYKDQIESGRFAITEYKFRDQKVRMFDETAVVSILADMSVKAQGHQSPMAPYRFTMVLQKQAGKWKIVAAHGTAVQQRGEHREGS